MLDILLIGFVNTAKGLIISSSLEVDSISKRQVLDWWLVGKSHVVQKAQPCSNSLVCKCVLRKIRPQSMGISATGHMVLKNSSQNPASSFFLFTFIIPLAFRAHTSILVRSYILWNFLWAFHILYSIQLSGFPFCLLLDDSGDCY